MTENILIKCLRQGGRSVHSFIDAQGYNNWDLPVGSRPGHWKGPITGELKPHNNGLHLAKKDYFIDWLTGYHYIAETRGETVHGLDCVIAREARLIDKLPIDDEKLQVFCLNQLSLLPQMMKALDVYPRISQDVEICVEIIKGSGLKNAHKALGKNLNYKYVRQNAMRLSYDALHSIEYQACTETSRGCLDPIVNLVVMSGKESNMIEHTKVISNVVAKNMDALYRNFHFMSELCDMGYNHESEVNSMRSFLENNAIICKADTTPNKPNPTMANLFRMTREQQNQQILPALGIIS